MTDTPPKLQRLLGLQRVTLPLLAVLGFIHIYLIWFQTPTFQFQAEVAAPLTRKLLFLHPATAWGSFLAYALVFGFSVSVLNKGPRWHDQAAWAAAEVGFVMNSIALWTGTFWGIPEWQEAGRSDLAVVYTEPKVLVVLTMWLVFLAILLLRRRVGRTEQGAKLAAIFGTLAFLFVPASFLTSRLVQTSLHPDIGGPGANPDAEVSSEIAAVLGFSAIVIAVLVIHLFLLRLHIHHLESNQETHHDG